MVGELPELEGFEPAVDGVTSRRGIVVALGITQLQLDDGPKDYVAIDVELKELEGPTTVLLDASDTAAIAVLAELVANP